MSWSPVRPPNMVPTGISQYHRVRRTYKKTFSITNSQLLSHLSNHSPTFPVLSHRLWAVRTARALWTYRAQCTQNQWAVGAQRWQMSCPKLVNHRGRTTPAFLNIAQLLTRVFFFQHDSQLGLFSNYSFSKESIFPWEIEFYKFLFLPGKYCHHRNYFLIVHCLVKTHVAKW